MNETRGKALVVGTGIGGIRSALDLAETGHQVTMIDKSPHMGGILSRLDYQFPTDRCGMCRMLPLIQRDQSAQFCLRKGLFHENIEILLSTTLVGLEGEPGKYKATLKQKKAYIDSSLCIGCGGCADVCPIEIPDSFNQGMGTKKAVYLPLPHAVPNIYTIDSNACTLCGECVTACPVGAVTLPEDQKKQFKVLVVDDELIVRDSVKEWLEYEGYSVEMAESGAVALQMIEATEYGLVLLDIKMGEMDGTEALKRAKDIRPDLNVVMMTAYATVETAVDTMKTGALEYVIKPFEPDQLMELVDRVYKHFKPDEDELLEIEAGAVILACGTDYYNPLEGKNTFGYKSLPDVVTGLEFERILSGTGPTQGVIKRPSTGETVKKIAWIQCVGSRSIQSSDAPYCSSICCMFALKEAVLAKKKSSGDIETVIYYMDMRCFGKEFEDYRRMAREVHNVILRRARPHSVILDPATGKLKIFASEISSGKGEDAFDMVVLSLGQRPTAETPALAEITGIELNAYGFPVSQVFDKKGKKGVFTAGSFEGFKDIAESVICSSSASCSALRLLNKPFGFDEKIDEKENYRDVSMETPDVFMAVCRCGAGSDGELQNGILPYQLSLSESEALQRYPNISQLYFAEKLCTRKGWDTLLQKIKEKPVNRVLLATCLPHLFKGKLKSLSSDLSLHPAYLDAVDIFHDTPGSALSKIRMGLARLRYAAPVRQSGAKVTPRVLVFGAGIAGMSAALAIADRGVNVVIVEKNEASGGHLKWLQKNIKGDDLFTHGQERLKRVEQHTHITLLENTAIMDAWGKAGNFSTSLRREDESVDIVEHGAVIIATGASEAETSSYCFGESDAVVTLKGLAEALGDNTIDPMEMESVVMIQCVDSRDDIKPYCSRICCTSSLKHALEMKKSNPDLDIYVLYRDMMSFGTTEVYFKKAREAGIIFIQYDLQHKPDVTIKDKRVVVKVREPIIDHEIEITSDILVLATGIRPEDKENPAIKYGAVLDQYSFFKEADAKWRPVDSIKEGVFACGTALGPRDVEDTVKTAKAAAMRAMRIITRKTLGVSSVTAGVKTSLCSLCERCIEACPFDARRLNEETMAIDVHPAMCQGCGSCAAVCPNSASFINGFKDQQMLEMIDAALSM